MLRIDELQQQLSLIKDAQAHAAAEDKPASLDVASSTANSSEVKN
jgi:hypothetical protein